MRARSCITAILNAWYLWNNIHQILSGRQGSLPWHRGEVIPCKVSIHVKGLQRVDISVQSVQLSMWNKQISCYCPVLFFCLWCNKNQASALVYFVNRLTSNGWIVTSSKLGVCGRDEGPEQRSWSSVCHMRSQNLWFCENLWLISPMRIYSEITQLCLQHPYALTKAAHKGLGNLAPELLIGCAGFWSKLQYSHVPLHCLFFSLLGLWHLCIQHLHPAESKAIYKPRYARLASLSGTM